MGKPKSSAYWWFMIHLQEQEKQNTGRSVSLQQISVKAGELWRQMSDEEKKPYTDQHESFKARSRPSLNDFLASFGQPKKEPKREVKEDPDASRPESRSSTASANISVLEEQNRKKKIIKALNKFIDETGIEKILKTKFYTIASNVMCATRKEVIVDGCVSEDVYYPLEVGIVEFTIADGIIYEYNQFVDPGPIPKNMARICHEHALKHEIPLSDFGLAKGCCKDPLNQQYITDERREDFDRVICDIHDLIVKSIIDEIQDTPEKPIKLLFCQNEQTFQNRGVLKALGKEAGYDNFADDIEIVDICELFFFLCRRKGFKLKALLLDILECTKFNYDGRCEYHASTESPYCAITVAKKHCWLMFEKLGELYNFTLTVKHKPPEEKKKEFQTTDDWISWEPEPPPKSSNKRRYYCEDFDEPNQPKRAMTSVVWRENIGRGKARIPNSSPFLSTDIRERSREIKEETEPIPGPSRIDFRPRLPGTGPSSAPSPFKSYEPRVDDDTKPKFSPASTPDTSRPLGRGRGRNTKANI